MEFDAGFNFTTVDDDYWRGLVPDLTADSEKILQEARERDIPVDEEVKVRVDSAFRMEGGGYEFIITLRRAVGLTPVYKTGQHAYFYNKSKQTNLTSFLLETKQFLSA